MPEIVVSEPDIDLALSHLRRDENSCSLVLPSGYNEWSRGSVIAKLEELICTNGDGPGLLPVGHGVYAVVTGYGMDISQNPDSRLQIWILVRPVKTDPDRLATLALEEEPDES